MQKKKSEVHQVVESSKCAFYCISTVSVCYIINLLILLVLLQLVIRVCFILVIVDVLDLGPVLLDPRLLPVATDVDFHVLQANNLQVLQILRQSQSTLQCHRQAVIEAVMFHLPAPSIGPLRNPQWQLSLFRQPAELRIDCDLEVDAFLRFTSHNIVTRWVAVNLAGDIWPLGVGDLAVTCCVLCSARDPSPSTTDLLKLRWPLE